MILEHNNDQLQPHIFSIEPKHYTFTANISKPRMFQIEDSQREKLKFSATQLPILINNAKTGQKLKIY